MGKFVIRTTEAGVKFDLKAANGQVIAGSEVYDTKAACLRGIRSVKKCAADAKLEDRTEAEAVVANPKFELYTDKNGGFRFRLKARNGKIIAVSERYTTKAACENGIESVRRCAPEAVIREE